MKTRISAPAHLSATGGRVSGLVKLYATRLLNSLSQSVSLFVTKFSYLSFHSEDCETTTTKKTKYHIPQHIIMGQFSRFQLRCMSLCSLIEWCSWDDDGEDDDDDNNDRGG